MIRRDYKGNRKRPMGALILGLIMWAGVEIMVEKIQPKWWWEVGAVSLLGVGTFLIGAGVTGSKKWAVIITFFSVGLIILRRFEILDWTITGLWLILLGGVIYANFEEKS